MFVFIDVPSLFLLMYRVLWRRGINLYVVTNSALSTAITPSSLLLSDRGGYFTIFGNAGIVFYTRPLIVISSFIPLFIGLISLCHCDNYCCNVYGPTVLLLDLK